MEDSVDLIRKPQFKSPIFTKVDYFSTNLWRKVNKRKRESSHSRFFEKKKSTGTYGGGLATQFKRHRVPTRQAKCNLIFPKKEVRR